MTKILKKTISSIIAFSLLWGIIPGLNGTIVQGKEQDKKLIQISEPGQFDDAAIYPDGSIMAFNKEKATTKVSVYDNSKKAFNKVNTYGFDQWYYITRSTTLENLVIAKDDKDGLLNKSAAILIEPKYDSLKEIRKDQTLYEVSKDNKRGYINHKNQIIVPIKYDSIEALANHKFLTEIYEKNTTYAIYDSITKSEIPLNYKSVSTFSYTDKFIKYSDDYSKYGVINLSGKIVIPAMYVQIKANDDDTFLVQEENRSWKLLNSNGKLMKDFSTKYSKINEFIDGLAAVSVNGKWGFINKDGEQIVKPTYHYVSNYSKGFAIVKGDTYLQGLIDTKGNEILKQKYKKIVIDRDDNYIMAINKNRKAGIYDCNGKQIIPFEYDDIGDFNHGYAIVTIGEKYGLIDQTNKCIIDINKDYLEIAGDTVKIIHDDKMTLYKIVDKEESKAPDKEDDDSKLEKLEEKQIGHAKISLFAKPDVVEEGTVIEIIPIEDDSVKDTIKLSLGDEYGNYVAYDINLLRDNVKVQPNGEITISISIPEGFDKDRLAVYRIEDNGTKTKMNGSVVGENYEFNVNHFSVYVLAEAIEDEDTKKPIDNEPNKNANEKKEIDDNKGNDMLKERDNTTIRLLVFLFFLCVSLLAIIIIKNKGTQR